MIPILELWEAAGGPEENLHMHRKNMQTPHRNVPTRIWTRAFSLWGKSNHYPTVQRKDCSQSSNFVSQLFMVVDT